MAKKGSGIWVRKAELDELVPALKKRGWAWLVTHGEPLTKLDYVQVEIKEVE